MSRYEATRFASLRWQAHKRRSTYRDQKTDTSSATAILAAATSIVLLAAILAFLMASAVASSLGILDMRISGSNGAHNSRHSLLDDPLAKDIRRRFSVPMRIMQSLRADAAALSQDERPGKEDPLVRLSGLLGRTNTSGKAVFVDIVGTSLVGRIRAVASVLEYARNTHRVPVIFWHVGARWRYPWRSYFFDVAQMEKHFGALIVDYEHPPKRLLKRQRDNMSKDWAELSVVDLGNRTLRHPVVEDNSEDVLTFGPASTREQEYKSLDGAATLDAHLSVRVVDGAYSKFAPPRTSMLRIRPYIRTRGQRHMHHEEIPSWLPPPQKLSKPMKVQSDRRTPVVTQCLHEEFDIPFVLLSGMLVETQVRLLWRLRESASRRRYKEDGFKSEKSSATRDRGYEQTTPRLMFIHAQYGLGNRLRAVGSAMAFAKETNRLLVIVWERDHHLNCTFGDLFVEQDDVFVSNHLGEPTERWPFYRTRSEDSKATHVMWYNFMRYNGHHVNDPSERIMDDPQMHIYVSSAYVVQSRVTPGIIRTQSAFWSVLRHLVPTVEVSRLVGRQNPDAMRRAIGVHIRSKMIENDISGVGADEYSEESSKRTDYWRNLTQVQTFLDEMHRHPQTQTFYVAVDDIQVLHRFEAEFPSRIHYTSRRCDSRERECLPYALADILLLAKCPSIRGSYWSSFSEVAVRISGGRFLLAGVDFGRPSKRPIQGLSSPIAKAPVIPAAAGGSLKKQTVRPTADARVHRKQRRRHPKKAKKAKAAQQRTTKKATGSTKG